MINRQSPEYQEAKWRVKISHFTEKGYDIKGVIHVGANDGYEIPFYLDMGIEKILAFEPIPEVYKELAEKYSSDDRVIVSNNALGNISGVVSLFITSGDGKSSSVLPLTDERAKSNPSETPTHSILVPMMRYDRFASLIDREKYDCLVCDVQGMELEVLKGFGSYLDTINYINIECSKKPIYEGEADAEEVIAFLTKKGFRQDTPIEEHDDIMFIRL